MIPNIIQQVTRSIDFVIFLFIDFMIFLYFTYYT